MHLFDMHFELILKIEFSMIVVVVLPAKDAAVQTFRHLTKID